MSKKIISIVLFLFSLSTWADENTALKVSDVKCIKSFSPVACRWVSGTHYRALCIVDMEVRTTNNQIDLRVIRGTATKLLVSENPTRTTGTLWDIWLILADEIGVMNRARQDLNEKISSIDNIRRCADFTAY